MISMSMATTQSMALLFCSFMISVSMPETETSSGTTTVSGSMPRMSAAAICASACLRAACCAAMLSSLPCWEAAKRLIPAAATPMIRQMIKMIFRLFFMLFSSLLQSLCGVLVAAGGVIEYLFLGEAFVVVKHARDLALVHHGDPVGHAQHLRQF